MHQTQIIELVETNIEYHERFFKPPSPLLELRLLYKLYAWLGAITAELDFSSGVAQMPKDLTAVFGAIRAAAVVATLCGLCYWVTVGSVTGAEDYGKIIILYVEDFELQKYNFRVRYASKISAHYSIF